jgi:hypothetical protein
MTTASHSLATALWRARFASGLLECGYTTNRDTTPTGAAGLPARSLAPRKERNDVDASEYGGVDSRDRI